MLYKYVTSLDTVAPFLLKTASSHPQTVEYSSTSPVGSLHLSTLIVEVCADGPPLLSLLEEVSIVPTVIVSVHSFVHVLYAKSNMGLCQYMSLACSGFVLSLI